VPPIHLEFFYGPNQAEVAFLHQIEERHSVTQVFLDNADYQAQVAFDEGLFAFLADFLQGPDSFVQQPKFSRIHQAGILQLLDFLPYSLSLLLVRALAQASQECFHFFPLFLDRGAAVEENRFPQRQGSDQVAQGIEDQGAGVLRVLRRGAV